MSDTSSEGSDYYNWGEEHCEQLLELYSIWQQCGEALFGSAFHQLGNLDTFVAYVHETTLLA